MTAAFPGKGDETSCGGGGDGLGLGLVLIPGSLTPKPGDSLPPLLLSAWLLGLRTLLLGSRPWPLILLLSLPVESQST